MTKFLNISVDNTLGGSSPSDSTVSSQKAIKGYVDGVKLGDLANVSLTNPSAGQNLTYDATNQVWKNTSTSATVAWGGITGTMADQTDLKNALDAKQGTLTASDGISISNNTISAIGVKNTNTANNVPNPVKIWQGDVSQYRTQRGANTIASTDVCVVTGVEVLDDWGSITDTPDNLFSQDYGSITAAVTPVNRASIIIGNNVVGEDILSQ